MTIPITTVYPFDPWGEKIGGIEAAIRSMNHHAPEEVHMSLIGMTEDPQIRPPGQWSRLSYGNRSLSFYPLASVTDPNRRKFIPLFLRFPWLLRYSNLNLAESAAIYHRIEPLALAHIPAKANILWIHGDPREMVGKNSEVKWRYLPQIYRKLETIAVRKADRIFVVSRTGLEYLQQAYPYHRNSIFFLPTWYEDDLFQLHPPDKREQIRNEFLGQYQWNPTDRFILFAGRWEEQKNPILALDAFAQVAANLPEVHLLLVGEGSLKPAIEARIRFHQLGNRISLLGSFSSSQMVQAMISSDVLLITSRFEGMPIVILEAQASGLPVVSTHVGEVGKIIHEGITGRIVSEPEPQSLAAALLDILQSPQNYRPEACAQAVEAYRCSQVLQIFYDQVRELVQ